MLSLLSLAVSAANEGFGLEGIGADVSVVCGVQAGVGASVVCGVEASGEASGAFCVSGAFVTAFRLAAFASFGLCFSNQTFALGWCSFK